MLATLLLAAALPLGLWPVDAGGAATVIDDVEFYLVEPDEDYYILAVQPLPAPLATPEPAAVKRLTALALRLGAHAVLLLAELDEAAIPDDLDEPLQPGERFVAAVFISFDAADDGSSGPTLTTLLFGGEVSRPPLGAEVNSAPSPHRAGVAAAPPDRRRTALVLQGEVSRPPLGAGVNPVPSPLERRRPCSVSRRPAPPVVHQ